MPYKDPEKHRICCREAQRRYRLRNPHVPKPKVVLTPEEKLARKKASRRRTYQKNKAKVLAQAAIYRANHKTEEKAARRAHYLRNREHVLQYSDEYRRANPEIYAEAQSRRRTRVPPWVKPEDTKVFYEMARRVSRCLGFVWEVDHIIPLQGRTISGLHVPLNLRVIPRSVNRRKSASFNGIVSEPS